LILARVWIGDVFISQNFGTAELMNADGFHVRVLLLRYVISILARIGIPNKC
jgi:hypothetical protein